MSLDIWLHAAAVPCESCGGTGSVQPAVYEANLTHNLIPMAEKAGLYEALWRPEELGIKKAGELVTILGIGLAKLQIQPGEFKALAPPNGWGTYHGLVRVVEDYLNACIDNPDADIMVDR